MKSGLFTTTRGRMLFAGTLGLTLFMALDPKPPQLPFDWFGDKFDHMLAFAVLTLLARLSFQRAPDWLILERLSFLGALIEVTQALPLVHRDCDIFDWLADTMAVAAVLLIVRMLRPRAR